MTAKRKHEEHPFQARVFLHPDEVYQVSAWSHELEPTAPNKRSTEDWVYEHLNSFQYSDFVEMLKGEPIDLSTIGDQGVQILITGRVWWVEGPWESPEDGETEIGVDSIQYALVPNEWFVYSTAEDLNHA